jgi:hypothetical protein
VPIYRKRVKKSRKKLKKRCEILKMAELSYHKNNEIFSNSDDGRTLEILELSLYRQIPILSLCLGVLLA